MQVALGLGAGAGVKGYTRVRTSSLKSAQLYTVPRRYALSYALRRPDT